MLEAHHSAEAAYLGLFGESAAVSNSQFYEQISNFEEVSTELSDWVFD